MNQQDFRKYQSKYQSMDIKFSFGRESPQIQLNYISRILPALLLLTDVFGLFVCFSINQWQAIGVTEVVLDLFLITLFVMILAGLYLANTYHPDSQIVGLRAPARIIVANAVVGILFASFIYITGAWRYNQLLWRSVIIPSLGMFTLWAVASRLWALNWVRSHSEQSRWLILGENESAMNFCRKFLDKHPFAKLTILAESLPQKIKPYELTSSGGNGNDSPEEMLLFYINRQPSASEMDSYQASHEGNGRSISLTQKTGTNERVFLKSPDINYLGVLADLPSLTNQPWSGVIVATVNELSDQQIRQLMPLRLRGIPIYRLPEVYESLWFKLPSSLLEDTWFAFSSGFNLLPGGFSLKLKRILDILLTSILLLALSPLMLITAIAIKLDSPGEVFYSQLRTGINGKPFRVYKFRSMRKDAEKQGAQWAAKTDNRITKVGKFIRLTRIDELPQIWNVLRGDMSLIGPRPERPEFDEKLRQEIVYYDFRYLVKPGITGWAQVMYPYGASIEDAYEKLSYDLYYIKNYSLWLDLAIVFKTIRVVLLGKGR